MEVLTTAAALLQQAKNCLIRAGIEINKCPVPIQHGCKLLRMVADLDKIQFWMQSAAAEQCESQAQRAKPRRRSKLEKKQSQSQVEVDPSFPTNNGVVSTPPGAAARLDILKQFEGHKAS